MRTADLISEYLGECEARGLSKFTTGQYRWALSQLSTRCPEVPLGGSDLLRVFAGVTHLEQESRRDLLKCLRTFFKWAGRRHKIPNPCLEMDPIPRKRHLPRVLTNEELEKLLKAAVEPYRRSQWQQERDRALILLAMDSGLRVGETASLRREDIGDGWLTVVGKVGARRVPVTGGLCDHLQVLGEGEYVWMGSRGPLTRSGVMQTYKRLFARAGVKGRRAGPHALRHTFATLYLRHGGGVRQLQSILGHERIETTMIYVHLAGRDVQADHALHSPVKALALMDLRQAE